MGDLPETSDDVIIEGQETQEVETPVEVQQAVPDQTSGDVIAEGQNETVEAGKDDFWKNRSYELERKLGNLTSELPKIIEDTLTKTTQKKEEKPQYTVAQLEAYALEHPEHRPWVEEQKAELLEKRFEEKLKTEEVRRQNEQIKNQAIQTVMSDGRYSDMFTVLPTGQKVFNPASEMTQRMQAYLADPRVNSNPDAFLIAAKLARADYVDSAVARKEQNLSNLKRQNAQLKAKTMVEGSGSNNTLPVRSNYDIAKENLAKTGSRKDAQSAVEEYFRLRGL
jgi:hypothetical protein